MIKIPFTSKLIFPLSAVVNKVIRPLITGDSFQKIVNYEHQYRKSTESLNHVFVSREDKIWPRYT